MEVFDEHKTALDEALGFLDVFLEGNDFVTGNNLTVADCSLAASVSSIVVRRFFFKTNDFYSRRTNLKILRLWDGM